MKLILAAAVIVLSLGACAPLIQGFGEGLGEAVVEPRRPDWDRRPHYYPYPPERHYYGW